MSGKRYTLTVYAAAPGTPVKVLDDDGNPSLQPSVPGHVYYGIDGEKEPISWGFAPRKHGSVNGPGKVTEGDADAYTNPLYARTMEISKDQYDRLKEFGTEPEKYGFDMTYKDVRNNCVDFTWAALNHAGIQRTHGHLGHLQPHGVDGKGSYLPMGAPYDFRSIRDPMPGSDLNKEVKNKAPAREWWQAPFGEFERPVTAVQSDPFEQLVAAAAAGDDAAFDKVGQEFLESKAGDEFLQDGIEHNRQQELAEQAMVQQQQALAVGMSMSM